ncbi:MAG: hypothetical protein MR551_10215, partial [Parabacteroides sp.]|nr:hypothetical protein [Parabacteroides sp.]
MKNELPVYFSFQISCVIIHLLTTKSLFAHAGLTHYNHFLLESILLQGGFQSASSSSTRKSEFHPAIFLFIAMLPFL